MTPRTSALGTDEEETLRLCVAMRDAVFAALRPFYDAHPQAPRFVHGCALNMLGAVLVSFLNDGLVSESEAYRKDAMDVQRRIASLGVLPSGTAH